jgi:regulator of replication initiation timing
MKFLPGNFEDLEQLREKHERLLREFQPLKDENRRLKDQLELKHIRNTPDSVLESKPEKADLLRNKQTIFQIRSFTARLNRLKKSGCSLPFSRVETMYTPSGGIIERRALPDTHLCA